jgi:H+/gluconate symporter-like permease
MVGSHMLQKVNERALRVAVVVSGVLLTIGMFFRS